jgi:hypothetical protein
VAEDEGDHVDEGAHDPHSSYALAYGEAVRALDYQRAALESLRTRVGVLLSGATIATSFLGGLAIKKHADGWGWLAIVLFTGFALISLRILWPRAEGAEGFTARPSQIIDNIIEGPGYAPWEVARELALHMEAAHDENVLEHLAPLTFWSRGAIALLILEILAWIIDLA